ncbi:hypothetical protein KEH56_36750 [Burkholderia cenocepacia]|uniref:hypothetical protein n=1 Tax=Burkholderia cenocepacia TaxID=95486 RepID=UPI001BA478F2|nr:hypothetical protein [Burkholderia cenocepacia]QUN44714.1 hypothetical protein KEH56_36750 [Burkholderia cenocepacia]
MTPDDDNLAALGARIADLVHDVSMLDGIVQLALETARRRVTYFARLAAIARYAVTGNHSDDERLQILESIWQLSEQYECDARAHRESLHAAYTLRQLRNDGGTLVSVDSVRH